MINPNAPFAATLDDIKPGVEFLTVYYGAESEGGSVEAAGDTSTMYETAADTPKNVSVKESEDPWRLCSRGVTPYANGEWSKTHLTIVNTPENRRKLVDWLIGRGAHRTAYEVIRRYVTDFVSVDTSQPPKGFVVSSIIVD